ncbi:MAG: prolipoprotein diacylglyceryl transferase [bacterium]|nr:prolipoprotein diacylglyceryl transferase [bacterium]
MNPIFIDLGFIQIYWYSITMLLAILTGSFLFYKVLKKKKISEFDITNILFYAVLFGIIGARVYYCLFNLDYYLKYPLEILEVWNGGLAIHGAILGGFIAIVFYCKKHKINILKITDAASFSVIIAQAIGRWGNFFNGEAHGGITTLETLKNMLIPNFIIKGMYIDGNYYLPTFYFEFLWNLIGFIVLFTIYKKYKNLKTGMLTGLYFMWYSFGRFFIEGLRTDSLLISNISLVVLITIFILLILFMLYKRYRKIDKKTFIISSVVVLILGILIILIFRNDLNYIRVAQFVSIMLFGIGLLITIYNSKDTRIRRLEMRE